MCLQTYLHLHDEGAVPFVLVENGIAFLGYEVLEPGLAGADQIAFGAMAIAVNMLRDLCGEGTSAIGPHCLELGLGEPLEFLALEDEAVLALNVSEAVCNVAK